LALFLAFGAVTAFSQTGKISGTVTDKNTGEALVGVNIIIVGTTTGGATDIEGHYDILNVKPGFYTVRASMIGYAPQVVEEVRVNIDQTTELNIQMTDEAYQTGEVVVIAEEPIVKQDVSSSRVNLNIKEIENLPVVSVENVVALQAGVQQNNDGLVIRGGSGDEIGFMVNGMSMRDERNNSSYTNISYTSIEEVQVQSGGFSAEYGNIRSGLVNVVTKEGSREKYNLSFIGRYSPEAKKHFGMLPNDPNAYWIRPFIDPDVAFVGTVEGWKDRPDLREQYPEFEGWNAIAEQLNSDGDPSNDVTPISAQQMYLYQHRRDLAIRDPDYDADMSLSGPFPVVSKQLGDLRFLFSFKRSETMYPVPLSRKGLYDYSYQLKLTSNITDAMKLSIDGLLGEQIGSSGSGVGDPWIYQSAGLVAYDMYVGGANIRNSENRIFNESYFSRTDIARNSVGAKFSHVLSPTTFYEVRFSRFESSYKTGPVRPRNTEDKITFGNWTTDEAPYGFEPDQRFGITGFRMAIGMANARDTSEIVSYRAKFDFNSQLDKYNNLKFGAEFVLTNQDVYAGRFDPFLQAYNYFDNWETNPTRGALYIQDKFEYEGMIANVGLRMDYSHAGGEWYVYDTYTSAFESGKAENLDNYLEEEPTERVVNLSPRLGISFPITVNSKLYFNYGHFYSTPNPYTLFNVRYYNSNKRVVRISSPNNPLPRTVAYEMGYEHNLFDMFLIRVAGYYKDVSDQPLSVTYVNRTGSVNYSTYEPNSYEDIRGFELSLSKNRGDWVQGFLNYTYMVSQWGRFGYSRYTNQNSEQREYEAFEDDNYVTKPVPRPYARANVDFFSPREIGPEFAGIYPLGEWRLTLLGSYSAGQYLTWTGLGGIPGVRYNTQWKDYYNLDLRVSKNFDFDFIRVQFLVDISNALNIKRMAGPYYGANDGNDWIAYMSSLHLPEETFEDFPGGEPTYNNWADENGNGGYVYGDDEPGDYRIEGAYIPWDDNAPQAQKDEWEKNKSYINMPNHEYFTFLNPRDIYYGIKLTVEL